MDYKDLNKRLNEWSVISKSFSKLVRFVIKPKTGNNFTYNGINTDGTTYSIEIENKKNTIASVVSNLINLVFKNTLLYNVTKDYDIPLDKVTNATKPTLDVKVIYLNNSGGYSGAVHTGNYIWFIPSYSNTGSVINGIKSNNEMVRLNRLDDNVEYIIDGLTGGFDGGCMVKNFLFISPYYNGNYNSEALWLHTATDIVNTIDLASGNSSAKGFMGAVPVENWVHFIPFYNGSIYHGIVPVVNANNLQLIKYINLAVGNSDAVGYAGAVVVGKNIYFIPSSKAATIPTALVSILDTETDEVSYVEINNRHNGAVYDGRYIYMSPRFDSVTCILDTYTNEVRYIDLAAFEYTDKHGYTTPVFDGRYVYYTPFNNDDVGHHGIIRVLDTETDEVMSFNISKYNGLIKGYNGAVYDGENIYLVPYHNGSSYHAFCIKFTALNKNKGGLHG